MRSAIATKPTGVAIARSDAAEMGPQRRNQLRGGHRASAAQREEVGKSVRERSHRPQVNVGPGLLQRRRVAVALVTQRVDRVDELKPVGEFLGA